MKAKPDQASPPKAESKHQSGEFRAAQAEIQFMLERFTDLYDFAPVGYFNLTEDGTIRLVNHAGAKLVGSGRGELLGREFQSLVPEPDRPAFNLFLQQTFVTRVKRTCELTLLKAGEPPRMVHLEASLAPDNQRCRLVILDITDRKQTEEQLRDLKNYQETLLAASPVGVVTFKASGSVVSVNEAAVKMIGTTAASVVRQNFRTLESWKNSNLLETAERALTSGAEQTCEDRLHTSFGVDVWLACRFVPFFFKGELHLLMLMQDITERKQAESAVRESEAFVRDVINSLSAHVAVLDDKGVILIINQAWQRFAAENDGDESKVGPGVNYLDVCQRVQELPPDKAAQSAVRGVRAVINGSQKSFALEYPCHSPTTDRWFLMNVRPLLGARRGVVVTHENITDLKRREKRRP